MHDVEANMWKRYDQIFNLRKFRQDTGMLDEYLGEESEWQDDPDKQECE